MNKKNLSESVRQRDIVDEIRIFLKPAIKIARILNMADLP